MAEQEHYFHEPGYLSGISRKIRFKEPSADFGHCWRLGTLVDLTSVATVSLLGYGAQQLVERTMPKGNPPRTLL